MHRKLDEFVGLLLIVLVFAALIWLPPAQSQVVQPAGEAQVNTITPVLDGSLSDDAQMIKDTILNALKIYDAAAYTFDTSQLAKVYINDPRGGGSMDSQVMVQELRQDPTLQRDQVGMLEGMQAGIEIRKRNYDNFMAKLRSKQADGSINAQEKFILDGETNGYPPATPGAAGPSPAPMLCARVILPTATAIAVSPTPDSNLHTGGYPGPNLSTEPAGYPGPSTMPPPTAYPGPSWTAQPPAYPFTNPITPPTSAGGMANELQFTGCATSTPTPDALGVYLVGRGPNPETFSPERYQIDIQSIKIEGEVARAVVQLSSNVIVEDVLVKVNGQWYIGGLNVIKYWGG